MIKFKSFTLDNGLRVIVHEDHTVQIAVLNILYDVGSRDEDPDKTGFAHLFEHLMFGGSKNIPNFDAPLQQAGGENNAFTSNDITNYYMTLPGKNIETGFWLESDRMLSLSFDPEVLEVQRKVVIEEFKQRYLNQPYGDMWLKLRPLAYRKHTYRWATIGKDINHIAGFTMDDVINFSQKHYVPNQAVMVVAGNVTVDQIKNLSEKWFGPIPKGINYERNIDEEPKQKEKRYIQVEGNVPADALYMTFHMPGKFHSDFYTADLISDILGRDKSSRLYKPLVRDKKYFSSIHGYVTGSIDPGLLVISGKVSENKNIAEAENAIWEIINDLRKDLDDTELQKVKNQAESSLVFSEMELLNRARNLAFFTLSGDTHLINEEANNIQAVTTDDIHRLMPQILIPENCSVMHYTTKYKSK